MKHLRGSGVAKSAVVFCQAHAPTNKATSTSTLGQQLEEPNPDGEASVLCDICGEGCTTPDDDAEPSIECVTCLRTVHRVCYGLPAVAEEGGGGWQCEGCRPLPPGDGDGGQGRDGAQQAALSAAVEDFDSKLQLGLGLDRCKLCLASVSKSISMRCESGGKAHLVCAIWTPNVSVDGMPKDMPETARYCLCRCLWNEKQRMVGCDGCGEWYHPGCLNLSWEAVKRSKEFKCNKCDPEAYEEGKPSPYSLATPSTAPKRPKRKRPTTPKTVRKRPALQPSSPPRYKIGDIVWAKWKKQSANFLGIVLAVTTEGETHSYRIHYGEDGDVDEGLMERYVPSLATEDDGVENAECFGILKQVAAGLLGEQYCGNGAVHAVEQAPETTAAVSLVAVSHLVGEPKPP